MTFEIPDFLNLTGRNCPLHKCPTYMIEGQERCGACDEFKTKKAYNEKMDSRMKPETLDDYNKERLAKRKGYRDNLKEITDNNSKQYKGNDY